MLLKSKKKLLAQPKLLYMTHRTTAVSHNSEREKRTNYKDSSLWTYCGKIQGVI